MIDTIVLILLGLFVALLWGAVVLFSVLEKYFKTSECVMCSKEIKRMTKRLNEIKKSKKTTKKKKEYFRLVHTNNGESKQDASLK